MARQSDTALQILVVARSLLGDVAAHGEQVPAGRCQFSLRAVKTKLESVKIQIEQTKISRDFRNSAPALVISYLQKKLTF